MAVIAKQVGILQSVNRRLQPRNQIVIVMLAFDRELWYDASSRPIASYLVGSHGGL